MIEVLEDSRTFHLKTRDTSMILTILDSAHLVCLYWGELVNDDCFSYIVKDIKRASYLSDCDGIKDFKLEQMPILYPAYGNPDMRLPAFMFEFKDGSRISDFRFQRYFIAEGKDKLSGLPTVLSNNAETIKFQLVDQVKNIEIILSFSVFYHEDAITQNVKVTNHSNNDIVIEKLMSANFSFLDDQFDCLSLNGAWGRECHLNCERIRQGNFIIDSKRGASGHGQNPFIALVDHDTNEDYGNVYSMNLVYSGNFEANVEVDMHQNTRMMIGINSFDFNWNLKADESFVTPETVMIYSNQGIGAMSRKYHHLYRDCLISKRFANREREILINNWEATYFDFNQNKLLSLAKKASELGIELFVLDDGWFSKRNDDTSSLGDWFVNEDKISGSLESLAIQINNLGMKFGLWFEPEMVSPNSNLYRHHPDWVIRVADYQPQVSRNQLVLDLCNPDVQNYIIQAVSNILDNANVEYVKWDMNRNITDSGSKYLPSYQQKEMSHRYILGLYRILDTLTNKYSNVLFEGCAGGGGRFDPGMLYYFPQIWTSDDTDAIERLSIQNGNSLLYPAIAMTAHVSAVPNHQVGRVTSINTRGIVAMQGNLGYELNLINLEDKDLLEIKTQVVHYKTIRQVVQFGDLYRLKSNLNEYAWLYVYKNLVVVSYVQILAKVNMVPKRLKLKGLKKNTKYNIVGRNDIYDGSSLMNIGLDLDKVKEDYYSKQWILREMSEDEKNNCKI